MGDHGHAWLEKEVDKCLQRPSLFQKKSFISAAGLQLDWKIECDALTDEDWQTIADICGPRLPKFDKVMGVPSGGYKIAKVLEKYQTSSVYNRILFVDDVWTTGFSMAKFAKENYDNNDWFGFVVFARTMPPPWVHYFMLSKYP